MLLESDGPALAQAGDEVLARLPAQLARHAALETHASVIELQTGVHTDVAGVASELGSLRVQLAAALRAMGLRAASAGTYPLEPPGDARVSRAPRYSRVAESMRTLARREPTFALHVHVGVPDPEDAIRVLAVLRTAVPVLLALSANSPFSHSGETGFASTRTVIFQGFPRTGPPRRFGSYCAYVEAVDVLIASGALPDPSFLWWDVRLQPRLGTVEVRVMDAQSTISDSASLIALVQSLARAALEGDIDLAPIAPEVLAENRFLAARDGLRARLIDPQAGRLVPVRALIGQLVDRCRPHAAALGCSEQLEQLKRLVAANGADRQRAAVAQSGLPALVSALAEQFSTERTD
jgi:carboxylate-amine ligase